MEYQVNIHGKDFNFETIDEAKKAINIAIENQNNQGGWQSSFVLYKLIPIEYDPNDIFHELFKDDILKKRLKSQEKIEVFYDPRNDFVTSI